eukprot:scaffold110227_cov33-Tisochrysis_lutea.AAC.1
MHAIGLGQIPSRPISSRCCWAPLHEPAQVHAGATDEDGSLPSCEDRINRQQSVLIEASRSVLILKVSDIDEMVRHAGLFLCGWLVGADV